MMRPNDIAKSGTEHGIQAALICYCNQAMKHGFLAADIWADGGLLPIRPDEAGQELPELRWLHAVHNQGHGDAVRGAKAKAEGVKAGVADLSWPLVRKANDGARMMYAGLYIEMKKPGGKVSLAQTEFATFVAGQGYYWASCDDWRQAADLIQMYMWGKL